MKKVVRNSTGSSKTTQAPSGTVKTVAITLDAKPQQFAASPTVDWSRYVDSRLKQFCLR